MWNRPSGVVSTNETGVGLPPLANGRPQGVASDARTHVALMCQASAWAEGDCLRNWDDGNVECFYQTFYPNLRIQRGAPGDGRSLRALSGP
ncbi:hypothetical protein GN956_G2148 [Arapaima gigas]